MKFTTSLMYAIKNLRRRKMRSWLTVLGIVIGIMTIVIITSIGDGVKAQLNKELESFGTDQMFILPINLDQQGFSINTGSRATSGKLFEKDFEEIEKVSGIKHLSKLVYGRTAIEFKEKQITATVYATDEQYFEIWGSMFKIEEGRILTEQDTRVAVLGYDAAHELFGKKEVSVGSIILIGGKKFRVIGIMEKVGSAFSQADDSSIYISFEDGKDLFKSILSKNEISFISIQLDEDVDPKEVTEEIEFRLMSLHKVTEDDKDFSVVTSDFINETIGSVLNSLSLFLFLITLIASFVGGIGISNTMLMSVIERVKEIGTLKSLGATDSDILKTFLAESGLLGLVGGVIGIIFGIVMLYFIGGFGIPYLITLELVLFALLFSFVIGLVSGFIPARRASKMIPVDAFRYE